MKISPPMVTIAGALSVAAIVAGAYVIGLHSRSLAEDRESTLAAQIAAYQRESEDKDARVRQLLAEIAAVERENDAGRALRRPDARNAVLAEIAETASAIGLQIDELVPGATVSQDEESEADDPVVATPISLRARGRITDTLRMIQDIHRTMPGIEVRTLSLTADPFAQAEGSISIGFVWYADRAD